MSTEQNIVNDLRDLATALSHDTGWSDDDIEQVTNAADMLEFFFGQMQTHSPHMGGKHRYGFRSGGWPMGHCIGPNAIEAVKSAVQEIKRERIAGICQSTSGESA